MKNPYGYFNVVNMRDPILLEILVMHSVASTSTVQMTPKQSNVAEQPPTAPLELAVVC